MQKPKEQPVQRVELGPSPRAMSFREWARRARARAAIPGTTEYRRILELKRAERYEAKAKADDMARAEKLARARVT